MINLDMILRPLWDNNPTQPKDADLFTRDTNVCLDWANIFIDAAELYVPSLDIDPLSPSTQSWGASDQGPFASAGLPAFGVIENTANEIWGGSNIYYHSSQDANDSSAGAMYDYLFAADIVRAAVATLAQEAQLIPEPATLLLLGFGVLMLIKRQG
jgi:hypothetical protein